MDNSKLLEIYKLNAERNHQLMMDEKKKLLLISVLRLFVFAGGICLSVAGFTFNTLLGVSLSVIFIALFLFLLNRYEVHSKGKEFYSNLENINLNEIRADSGDLSAFCSGDEWINPAHEYSHDIDLFGKDSLFQFLNRTVTGHGREKLALWLSDPCAISEDLKLRQQAVRELSSKISWRQEFIAAGIGKSLEKEDIEKLLGWLNDSSGFKLSQFLGIIIWICPILTITSLLLVVTGLLPYQVFTSLFIINLLIILSRLKDTGKIHRQVSKTHAYLTSLNSLLFSLEKESFNSALMKKIKKDISSGDLSAVHSLAKLSRIIQSFDSRLNPFVGIIFNGFLMWDMHCIRSIEKWKRESKNTFPAWLDKIGEIDALLSLANLAYNNPTYSYPVLSENGVIFSASNMGHPLIKSNDRVCNDLIIPGGGKIFIITGANMSGKSTFLRTVAVNFILAMTGCPVCASEMKFRPVKLFTSMRTTDSLSHNESYFYAELKRLKILKTSLEKEENTFFILDEILKGTNSADKSNGSKQFMRKMVELRGTGLIATHDTSLCELQKEFPEKIFTKCFELEIDGEKISFDYKLIDGVASKMNAALLMKQMGIA